MFFNGIMSILIDGQFIDIVNKVHPSKKLTKAGIGFFMQIMMKLSSRPVIFGIVYFINVKVRSCRSSCIPQGPLLMGILLVILLKGQLVKIGLDEFVHVYVMIRDIGSVVVLVWPRLKNVSCVDGKCRSVPQFVTDLLQEHVNGNWHFVEWCEFNEEDTTDTRPFCCG